MGVHLEAATELLLDVAVEHLDVAGLVDDLGGRVELGVVPGHGLGDLGGAQQRALLAVEELRERPAALVDAELEPLLVTPLLDDGAVVVVGGEPRGEGGLVLVDHLVEFDLGVPREVGGGVPLTGLGLLVELAELGPREGVVPGEDGVGVVLDDVLDLVDVDVGHRQDGLDVVDVVASDDVAVRGVLGGAHDAPQWVVGVDGVYSRSIGCRNDRALVSSPRSTSGLGARK